MQTNIPERPRRRSVVGEEYGEWGRLGEEYGQWGRGVGVLREEEEDSLVAAFSNLNMADPRIKKE